MAGQLTDPLQELPHGPSGGLPGGLIGELIGGLTEAVDALGALDADTLTAAEAATIAEPVERERNRLDAVRASLLGPSHGVRGS